MNEKVRASRRVAVIVLVSVAGISIGALLLLGGYFVGRNLTLPNQIAANDQGTGDRNEPMPTQMGRVSAAESDPVDRVPQEASQSPSSTHSPHSGSPDARSQPVDPKPALVEPTIPAPAIISETRQTPTSQRSLELTQEDLDLLLEVWQIVAQEFDGSLPSEEEISYAAISGSLELLRDQFTRFIPPEIAQRSREQLEGSFEGIGAFVELNDEGLLVIVRPIEDQPADLAGLNSGDLVTHVDGNSVIGKSLDELVSEVKGPQGTKVTLTIRREGVVDPFDVTIVRDRIVVPVAQSEMLEEDIAYARLTGFGSSAVEQLNEALEQVAADQSQGLIFDLRGNPGGFLNQSVAVADLFLADGVVVIQRDSTGLEQVFRSDAGDIYESVPLVVLVNGRSASASEIVAGAIQDRGRGIVIGQTTFGKGSVQQPHTLSNDSELRVTIARWYTPDGRSIDQQGIVPDIEVGEPDEPDGEEDPQLQRAIEYLLDLN